jgi:CO/xanthine dehydrogenase Mo-binding subunit
VGQRFTSGAYTMDEDLIKAFATEFDDRAVGIECHERFETGVACAVEVSIEDNRPKIHRATIAVDPGFAVNP